VNLERQFAVGVFPVPITVWNRQNRFLPPERRGEEVVCTALVDSGAVELALPAELFELPHGSEPLLGTVPLEEMDWHISPQRKELVPNPKSPDRPMLPLC
jgi:hypothetical protein